MIRRVLLALFDGESSDGALSWRLYVNGIPVPTLAFVCTVVSACLDFYLYYPEPPLNLGCLAPMYYLQMEYRKEGPP